MNLTLTPVDRTELAAMLAQKRGRPNPWRPVVAEFVNSPHPAASIEFDDAKTAQKASQGIRDILKRDAITHVDRIVRGTSVVIYRKAAVTGAVATAA